MDLRAETRRPIATSLFVVAVTMVVLSFGSGLIFGILTAAHRPPVYLEPVFVGLTSIVAPSVAGAGWFRIKINRAMSGRERLRFALGVLAVSLLLKVGGAGLMMVLTKSTIAKFGLSPEHLFKKYLYEIVLSWAGLFYQLLTFAQAYFVGWIMTRNNPDDRRRELERVFGD